MNRELKEKVFEDLGKHIDDTEKSDMDTILSFLRENNFKDYVIDTIRAVLHSRYNMNYTAIEDDKTKLTHSIIAVSVPNETTELKLEIIDISNHMSFFRDFLDNIPAIISSSIEPHIKVISSFGVGESGNTSHYLDTIIKHWDMVTGDLFSTVPIKEAALVVVQHLMLVNELHIFVTIADKGEKLLTFVSKEDKMLCRLREQPKPTIQ